MERGRSAVAQTMAARLRDIARVLDRLDRLEAGSGTWLVSTSDEELAAAALQMTLRTVRTAADPVNFEVLHYLSARETCPVADVQASAGLDRMSLSERLNDMVQVGLLVREIDTDHVQATDAGKALVSLFSDMQQETARHLAHFLTTGRLA